MDVCFCRVLCDINLQLRNVWQSNLMELKIKKISHYIHYTNENNNDSQ